MLILKSLAVCGKLHGYEIADNIQRTTDDVLQVEEGSLYPRSNKTKDLTEIPCCGRGSF
ncbi:MAG: helix-turn-helix transcriptional regulator [Alloacidobacterium sp.]